MFLLANLRLSKLFSGNGDYQIRNVTKSRVYYVEGLGHNLFSVGQFCDSNLKAAFRQHTCFIRNLEGVDLLTGSRGNNLYTLSLGDMMASSHICKSKKKPYKPKFEDTNQEKLYLLHMDLCGPMHVASVNGKKYILVIVDEYSRFTWVKCLRSKDEAPDFIIKFLKMIQVRLKTPVRRIRTDNVAAAKDVTVRLLEYMFAQGIIKVLLNHVNMEDITGCCDMGTRFDLQQFSNRLVTAKSVTNTYGRKENASSDTLVTAL
ncbi:putative ribonuclease H-like domain-containing protein [Tanacetum coccineum]